MTWQVDAADDGVHVTPNADLVAHDRDDDCACGPAIEPVIRDGGSVNWLITHHSLDGREAKEGK